MGKQVERREGAQVEVRLGKHWGMTTAVSPAGLWAVAGLVAAALIGSAAVVHASRR